MSTEIAEIATAFLTALEAAAKTGDRDPVYPFLAPDAEWVTPQRDLVGIDEIRRELTWVNPPDKLDLEFERGDWSSSARAASPRRAPGLHAEGDGRVRVQAAAAGRADRSRRQGEPLRDAQRRVSAPPPGSEIGVFFQLSSLELAAPVIAVTLAATGIGHRRRPFAATVGRRPPRAARRSSRRRCSASSVSSSPSALPSRSGATSPAAPPSSKRRMRSGRPSCGRRRWPSRCGAVRSSC